MFTYLSAYSVLICNEHQHAVYSLDEHLKRHHSLLIARRRELLTAYAGLAINTLRMNRRAYAPGAHLRETLSV
jgi:hypothetical protein